MSRSLYRCGSTKGGLSVASGKKRLLAIGVALATLLGAGVDASAEQPTDAALAAVFKSSFDRLAKSEKEFLNSPSYLQKLAEGFNGTEPGFLKKSCPTVLPVERRGLDLLLPNGRTALPDGHTALERPQQFKAPTIGAWVERWWVERCGARVVRTLLVFKTQDQNIVTKGAIPGKTAADPLLQIDTLRIGVGSFLHAVRDCADRQTFQVIDSVITSWTDIRTHSEDWTVAMCDKTTVVHINYSPGEPVHNPNGTTIVVQGPS